MSIIGATAASRVPSRTARTRIASPAPSPDRAKWRHHVRHQSGEENGVRGDRLASSAAQSGAIRASPASSVIVSTPYMVGSAQPCSCDSVVVRRDLHGSRRSFQRGFEVR